MSGTQSLTRSNSEPGTFGTLIVIFAKAVCLLYCVIQFIYFLLINMSFIIEKPSQQKKTRETKSLLYCSNWS